MHSIVIFNIPWICPSHMQGAKAIHLSRELLKALLSCLITPQAPQSQPLPRHVMWFTMWNFEHHLFSSTFPSDHDMMSWQDITHSQISYKFNWSEIIFKKISFLCMLLAYSSISTTHSSVARAWLGLAEPKIAKWRCSHHLNAPAARPSLWASPLMV